MITLFSSQHWTYIQFALGDVRENLQEKEKNKKKSSSYMITLGTWASEGEVKKKVKKCIYRSAGEWVENIIVTWEMRNAKII
jgi:hypothetical protein